MWPPVLVSEVWTDGPTTSQAAIAKVIASSPGMHPAPLYSGFDGQQQDTVRNVLDRCDDDKVKRFFSCHFDAPDVGSEEGGIFYGI